MSYNGSPPSLVFGRLSIKEGSLEIMTNDYDNLTDCPNASFDGSVRILLSKVLSFMVMGLSKLEIFNDLSKC